MTKRTSKTYKILRDGKPLPLFNSMQKGFASGAFFAIRSIYNLPHKYELVCEQTQEVIDSWGPNQVKVN